MPKGALESSEASTTGQPLREQLRRLEIAIAGLKRRRVDVEALLLERDALERALEEAEAQGLDVRAERGRAATFDALVRQRADRLVRLGREQGGLAAARGRQSPPERYWWWWLDEWLSERRWRELRRSALILVSIAAVLLIGNQVLLRFFGAAPERRAFSDLTWEAGRLIDEGKLVEASKAYERAIEQVPDDPEALCTLAVLYELQGRAEEAAERLSVAEQASATRAVFLFDHSRAYLVLGKTDRALRVAETALQEDPTSPYAYFALGSALEVMGERNDAALAFDAAAHYAMEIGEDKLYALARQRQAVLLGAVP